ncbi:hypothetical protein IVB18_50545 (plasmid) [Bradyrhizobium sp. 186]|uniref:hypothetical protein n=1 Tax=Bradyrhizobium sp. 186 TaxID=2782654 RepID=UPI002000A2F9|nr:hypothetical protein [Bradyrhizobium sp. 186]UPK40864.1 hypothetical protein IVB18_50545 [Bradyrhizobium sp. 186]
MGNVNVAVNVTSQFSLDRFQITSGLAGAKHEFIFDERPITLSLPPAELEGRGIDVPIMCVKWQSEGMVPLEYRVSVVDLAIELAEPVDIPEELLGLPPSQRNLLDKDKIGKLDTLTQEAGDTLKRAFEHWLRVLRWKSRTGSIGEPQIKYAGPDGGGSFLTERATQKRLWRPPHRIRATLEKAVTSMEWDAVQVALSSNKQPPVWIDFLFEARMRMNNEDRVGGVLTLAIAFEVSLRKIFSAELEKLNADPAVLAVLDVANLRALLTWLKKTRAWNGDWEDATEFSTLHKLMDYRDGVMHMAKVERLNDAELRSMYAAVEKFAYFTSRVLGLD